MGFVSKRVDKELGPGGDLSLAANRNLFLRDARCGKVAGSNLGPPCTTLSTMQDLTRVIRTRRYPKGVPGLSSYDQARVDEGNVQALFSLRIFAILMRKGLPCIIENPRASRLWFFQEVLDLIEQGAVLLTLDLCAYGTRWRKRTGLLVCNLEADAIVELQRLCGGSNGLCGHTGKPHILLKGKDPQSGKNWTSLGQVYPKRLCRAIAKALSAQAINKEIGANRYLCSRRSALPE